MPLFFDLFNTGYVDPPNTNTPSYKIQNTRGVNNMGMKPQGELALGVSIDHIFMVIRLVLSLCMEIMFGGFVGLLFLCRVLDVCLLNWQGI